jgi:hypothetical protein
MNIRSWFFGFLSIILLSSLYACKSSKKHSSSTALVSHEEIMTTSSILNVPIVISLKSLENQINKEFEGVLFEENTFDNNKGGEKYHVKVSKKENITLESFHDQLRIKVPLQAWAKTAINLPNLGIKLNDAPETNFSLNLYFTAKPELDQNYKFKLNLKADGFDWVKRPGIRVGFFDIPLGSIATPFIDKGQQEMVMMLEKEIEENLQFKNHIQKAWTEIQQPVLVSKLYHAWLSLQPQTLYISPFKSNSEGNLVGTIGVQGLTSMSIGNQPHAKTSQKLPTAILKDSLGTDFEMNINSLFSFEQTAKILAENLAGKNYQYRKKKSFRINTIHLSERENELVIKASVSGDINDTIMLKGKPYYDEKTQSLNIALSEFNLKPESKFEKASIKLAKGLYKKELEKALHLPLKDMLAQTNGMIDQALNNYPLAQGMILNGELLDFYPSLVVVTPHGILTQLKVKGNANIELGNWKLDPKKFR